MTKANERQVGGSHYKRRDYQHWDFVTDVRLPYLLGVGSKYVSRWREKNGVEDLQKTLHYIDKAKERGVDFSKKMMRKKRRNLLKEFAEQHDDIECFAIVAICTSDYDAARFHVGQLIEEAESAQRSPTPTPQA